jgi:hypothetical protein
MCDANGDFGGCDEADELAEEAAAAVGVTSPAPVSKVNPARFKFRVNMGETTSLLFSSMEYMSSTFK